jgi:hypothetical protein
MKVKTILITVREDHDGRPGVLENLPKGLRAAGGGGKCIFSVLSSFHIVMHGLGNLFSRSEIYYYDSSSEQRPEPPNDGPPRG